MRRKRITDQSPTGAMTAPELEAYCQDPETSKAVVLYGLIATLMAFAGSRRTVSPEEAEWIGSSVKVIHDPSDDTIKGFGRSSDYECEWQLQTIVTLKTGEVAHYTHLGVELALQDMVVLIATLRYAALHRLHQPFSIVVGREGFYLRTSLGKVHVHEASEAPKGTQRSK